MFPTILPQTTFNIKRNAGSIIICFLKCGIYALFGDGEIVGLPIVMGSDPEWDALAAES
ncbi:hypothetical protein GCM10007972_21510 [Iodidimonas muriae]|uniref:Uncharacterized protein n=1 Tax=Iodidimonas muriae TaxID=261467 RepID=A0ABQ2LEX7_9PROT|nr:hypothetical protein JCM17843_17680 [Kordiimonadales bacterium JCM 17843]GGO14396.1 hypothetical protein GCM10007972_21510 [Iodidimonas muriae]